MGTRSNDYGGTSPTIEPRELTAARGVLDDLAAGRGIAAKDLRAACDTLLDRLTTTGSTSGESSASDALCALFAAGLPVEDRGEILGALLSQGPSADRTLGALLDGSIQDLFDGHLSAAERDELRDLTQQPMGERVQRLALMLADASKHSPNHPPDGRHHPIPSDLFALPPRRNGVPEIEQEEGNACGPDPESLLRDDTAAEEFRVDAALQLGVGALPTLRQLSSDPRQHEVVVSALVHMGRDPHQARAVRLLVSRMQHDPATSAVGTEVRHALEGVVPHPKAPLRERTEIGGWMRRALDDCDAPMILLASAGREHLILPALMRRIFGLRRAHAAAV